MKPLLHDYASNAYSQLGEDGMIERLLADYGVDYHTCAEFGAWDGLHCSNTALLWRDQDWTSIQIEPHEERYGELVENAKGYAVQPLREIVTPANVDRLLTSQGSLDLLSIDVDGYDYEIFEAMTIRPRIVVIEFNQSVPPHLDIRQVGAQHSFSASGLAMKRLAERKGYRFAGRSESNLFFVEIGEPDPAEFYNVRWEDQFSAEEYTYVVGDMTGNITLVGRGPFWGYGTAAIDYPLRTAGPHPPWKKYLEFE